MGAHRFFSRLKTPLYAIIDTARDRKAYSLLDDTDSHFETIYPHRFSLAMDHRGPHLIPVCPNSTYLDRLIHASWGKSWGIYLAGPSDLSAVRRHLRRLLCIKLRDGQQALFRFYDPRVLRDYLPNCSEEELYRFFGPLTAIYLESQNGCEILCFSLNRPGKTDEYPCEKVLSEYSLKLT
jgi:hypothetical protein